MIITTSLCIQLRKIDNYEMLVSFKESISVAFPRGSFDMYISTSVSMSHLKNLNGRVGRRQGTVLGFRAHRDKLVKKGCMRGGDRFACG